MITSPDNDKLKTIRKLQQKRWREKLGLFAAEGEDLIEAAAAADWRPEFVLRAGADVEPELLDAVSTLASGTRVIGVYPQRRAEPEGELLVYLHGVEDPGNVGTIIRSAHALADATVVLGPGCADPYSPKAVRASMGSIFAKPPGRAHLAEIRGRPLALDPSADRDLGDIDLVASARARARIGARRDPGRAGGGPHPGGHRFAERRHGGHRCPLRGGK